MGSVPQDVPSWYSGVMLCVVAGCVCFSCDLSGVAGTGVRLHVVAGISDCKCIGDRQGRWGRPHLRLQSVVARPSQFHLVSLCPWLSVFHSISGLPIVESQNK